jgi:Flp pilus assembly protein TadD
LYEEKRWDEALGYCRAALALRPEAGAAHNSLGLTLQAKGQLDEAIGHFQKALQLDSENVIVHNSLGIALYDKGQVDEAIALYQQALRIDPKFAGAHHSLGFALRAKGRLDEAIDHYRESIRLDPMASAIAHHNLGSILRVKGRLEEAIEHYHHSLRLNPKLEAAQIALGNSLYAAACAAVGTAAGQGSEKGRSGEPEEAGLRLLALNRLRATLELTAKLRNDGKVLSWSLASWQSDPALASVRDPALAKLPDAEREQWQRLWADVAAQVAADPLEQGWALVARRDWAHATDRHARALARGTKDEGHFWFEYAALLLLSGDRPAYVRACSHMIEAHGKVGGGRLRSYHVARA